MLAVSGSGSPLCASGLLGTSCFGTFEVLPPFVQSLCVVVLSLEVED